MHLYMSSQHQNKIKTQHVSLGLIGTDFKIRNPHQLNYSTNFYPQHTKG